MSESPFGSSAPAVDSADYQMATFHALDHFQEKSTGDEQVAPGVPTAGSTVGGDGDDDAPSLAASVNSTSADRIPHSSEFPEILPDDGPPLTLMKVFPISAAEDRENRRSF